MQREDILKIASGALNDRAKSWLDMVGIDYSADPALVLEKAVQKLTGKNLDMISGIENMHPDVIKAGIANFLVDRLGRKIERELGVTSDIEEGLVTYLGNVALSEDRSEWNFHQDDIKTAYAKHSLKCFQILRY